MIKTSLELDFLDGFDKKFKLSILDPKEDLEKIEIESAMDTILEKNIFLSNNTDLVKSLGARIIKTTVNVIEF